MSHPKVDDHAGVPAGTTSAYFRTRRALLQAIAERLTELDVADLSLLDQLVAGGDGEFTGTAGLARIVMYSATEPWLTRAKARYELMLHASRDAELAATLEGSIDGFYGLAHSVVAQWHPEGEAPDEEAIERQATAVLTFVNGVMMTFVAGKPLVANADELDAYIRAFIAGIAATPDLG